MNWYLKALNRYFDFTGRSRRMEYWMFGLFNFIFGALFLIIDWVLIETVEIISFPPLYIFYSLMIFIPSISVSVRRLHDVGKSGWMLLISLIPIIGSIWLLVLFLTDGDSNSNEYGQNPKNLVREDDFNTKSTTDLKNEKNLNIKESKFDNEDEETSERVSDVRIEEKQEKSMLFNIIISIIGFILVSIIFLFFIRESLTKSRAKKEIAEIIRILEIRKKELGFYPQELKEIIGNNPLRKKIDIDFWGNEYHYKLIDNGVNYILISKGKDEILGTADDIGVNND
ncbi:DUF805 domain-containing protein [Lutibacter sp. A80]|uniref:DUF805 domain-containing protein n=1 Tax=Lutibacter sp. A80 TaxID=2918453 RepID=UPI003530229D